MQLFVCDVIWKWSVIMWNSMGTYCMATTVRPQLINTLASRLSLLAPYLHSSDCQSKEQHQPGAADATENSRQRRRARRAAIPAAAAPAASLPPLPPSKPCAEAADPPAAGLREAVALPPGLDASSTKRRVDFVAAAPSLKRVAVDLRPPSVQLGACVGERSSFASS